MNFVTAQWLTLTATEPSRICPVAADTDLGSIATAKQQRFISNRNSHTWKNQVRRRHGLIRAVSLFTGFLQQCPAQ
jgi:hypothetical protein